MPPNSAAALFREGRLTEAIAAQTAQVRAVPGDVRGRWFLVELLCVAAEWERADRLLDVIASQEPDLAPAVLRFRHLLRGEETRRQVLRDGRAPQLIGQAASSLHSVVETLLCVRENRPADALRKIEEAGAATASVSGVRNGQHFEDFRDLDDVLSPILDFVTKSGEYFWVAVADVSLLETRPPSRARDLLWCPARLEVRDGPAGEVYLPVLYVSGNTELDDAIRLGRRTEWSEGGNNLVRGRGLRMFLVGDDDVPIHQLGLVAFEKPSREP